MPIYEYHVVDTEKGCEHCSNGFDELQKMTDSPLAVCPKCGAPVRRWVAPHSVGNSRTGLDDKAKHAGLHKLKRLGKGEYEKVY